MQRKMSLEALARELAARAGADTTGRSSETVFGGHERTLRQTAIALTAGQSMSEHESPGDATLYVLQGRVRLTADADAWEARTGDLLIIPDVRHGLEALENSVILLTVAKT
ncbi:cupin domain-containing protein [Actinoallomurus oryzae]|uniref:Cupin domain-containing protein n=1 Tax=Actinoallomurus oryzae TaxID=502180 RepID=A0ABP8QGL2_9ACTN